MKDALSNVNGWVTGLVTIFKSVIVFFVFANILYSTGTNPIGGLIDLVNSLVGGGLAGLLALIVFASFTK
jgi:Na+/proline symporter